MNALAVNLGRFGRAVGLAAFVVGSGPALAADTPEQIIDAYMANYRALGATKAEYGAISQDGDVTAIEGIDVVVPIEVPLGNLVPLRGTMTVSSPAITVKGFSLDGDTFEADRLTYPEGYSVHIDFDIDSPTTTPTTTSPENALEDPAEEGKSKDTATAQAESDLQTVAFRLDFADLEIANYRERKFSRPTFDPATPIRSAVAVMSEYAGITQAEVLKSSKLELRVSANDVEQTSQYDSLVIRGIKGHEIDSYEVESASQRAPGNLSINGQTAPVTFDVKTGRISADHIDLRPLYRFADPALFPDLTNDIVAADGRVNDYAVEIPENDATVTLDELSFRNYALGKPDVGLAEILEPLLFGQLSDDPEELVATIFPVLTKYNLGQFTLRDLRVNKGTARVAQVGRVAVSDLTEDGIGSVVLEGAGVSNPDNSAQFGLSRFAVTDIGYSSIKALIGFEQARAAGDVPAMLAAIPTVGGIEIEDFAMAPANAPVTLSIASYRLAFDDFIGPIPTRISNVLDGLNLPVAMITNPNVQRVVSAMGFDALKIDQTLKLDWNEATNDLTLEQAGIRLENGGNATLRLTLGGVPKILFEDPTRAQEAIATLSIKSGSLVIEDAAVLTAMLEQEAAKHNVPVETIRSGTVAQVRAALGPLAMTPFADELSGALDQFLSDPKRLEIRIEPASPVYAAQLLGLAATAPDTIPGLLNTTISAD